jgi:hypothetical protein
MLRELPPASPPAFVVFVSVVSSSYLRTFVLGLVMYRTYTLSATFTTCDDWSGPHAVGLGPGGTPSRGRRRRNRRRKPSCTSRRRWAEEAGSAGRSRRSRCRRCSLRTRRRGRRRRSGSRRCRDAPVGAPPEGNAKEVTRRRRRVTTAASRDDSVVAHGSLPAAWSGSGTVARGGHW